MTSFEKQMINMIAQRREADLISTSIVPMQDTEVSILKMFCIVYPIAICIDIATEGGGDMFIPME